MKKFLTIMIILSAVATSCGQYSYNDSLTDENIDKVISSGEYSTAKKLIKYKIATEELTPEQIWDLNYKIEKMDRIRKDFNKNESAVKADLKRYYPIVSEEEIAKWEKNNVLEHKVIEGEKMYFRNAARNVFRIDPEANLIFERIHPDSKDDLGLFLADYIPEVVKSSKKKKTYLTNPVDMKIRYTLSVKPNEVPSGEVIRVWMPYIQEEDIYKNIKLVNVSQPSYIISPEGSSHKSIYMEKKAEKGKSTDFWYELSFTSYNKFSNFDPSDISPYDKYSKNYRYYTSERPPHIVFSDRIKTVTDSLTKGETNPYIKSVIIFDWICDNYPWASAREYSTIDNIPEYVLDNNHGDCGQVGLLFITMARYAGIPAKWESGWMLHPMEINLHDWCRVFFEGIGWVGVDPSFGRVLTPDDLKNDVRRGKKNLNSDNSQDNEKVYHFFTRGMDAYRFIVNTDYSRSFYPAKIFPRSETIDFQRGEVEWRGGNLYFDRWNYDMEVL
jgi:transglutaminase-like putative cysteine protease